MSGKAPGDESGEVTRAGEPDVERPPPVLKSKTGLKPPDIFKTTPAAGDKPGADARTESWRPTLVVQVVNFHEGDRKHALDLGKDLYDTLCRPIDEPLAFGAGVQVMMGVDPEHVDLHAAKHVVVVCALGFDSFNSKAICKNALETMAQWRADGEANHVIPVAFHANWKSVDDSKTGLVLTTELSRKKKPRGDTLIGISENIAQILSPKGWEPRLFISHAKADLEHTGGVAKEIYNYSTDTRTRAFFDRSYLTPGEDLSDQLDEYLGHANVFVIVRSDSYSSRAWCVQELLWAKRGFIPTLSVEVLRNGEFRSTSFGGNSPGMVWDRRDPACAQKVLLRAIVEWIKAHLFEAEAGRIHTIASMPETVVHNRPPELMDLSGKPGARMMMYPDPELSLPERQELARANKRLYMTTPTTAYRALSPAVSVDRSVGNPLDGMKISFSVSDSTDFYGPEGFTEHHFIDAVTYVARCLVSAGVQLAYGGDFRSAYKGPDKVDKYGFTRLFIDLIQSYSQTAAEEPELVHSFLASPIEPDEDPRIGPVNATLLRELKPTGGKGKPVIPWQKNTRVPAGLYFSDMRRVMGQLIDATVFIGGQTRPKIHKNAKTGYGGRYPGVVEEAWRMLKLDKPIYVAGGFGGAAGIVADLLQGSEPSPDFSDVHWMKHKLFRETAADIGNDQWREYRNKLKLPETMDDLGREIQRLGKRRGALDGKKSVEWNGLTVEENLTLFRTRDPVELAGLVFKGMLNVAHSKAKGKLSVELVRGDVLAAEGVDALSVPLYEGVPMGGAAGALDKMLGGALHRAHGDSQSVVSVKSSALPVDWIHLAELEPAGNRSDLPFDVASAARDAVGRARRFRIRQLGVVLYGGSVLETKTSKSVDAMLRAFKGLAGRTKIVWYESDAQRFSKIEKALRSKQWREDIVVSTRKGVLLQKPKDEKSSQRAVLTVSLSDDDKRLTTMLIPPEGTGIARSRMTTVKPETIKSLGMGVGRYKRSVPDPQELVRRGKELSRLLLGQSPEQFFPAMIRSGLQITHNVNASKIPFEMLATARHPSMVAQTSVNRRLMVDGAQARELFADPPPLGRPRALLIINPTGDERLIGAEVEGETVGKFLAQFAAVKRLHRGEATRERVLSELEKADLVHYCGHAFYEGPGPDDSGLCMAGDKELTLRHIQQLSTLPRLAFFNACEAGRVRARASGAKVAPHASKAAAFAEFFLGGGVEAYVGTHWFVSDNAAQSFAEVMYGELAKGSTVSAAVLKARQKLFKDDRKDWANYILYGEGEFRLKG